jgi:hypothetical protein
VKYSSVFAVTRQACAIVGLSFISAVLRSIANSKSLSNAKEKHGMRYTPYRGLAQVTKWVRLKFAALNLKKLAIHLRKDRQPSLFYTVYIPFLCSDLVFA